MGVNCSCFSLRRAFGDASWSERLVNSSAHFSFIIMKKLFLTLAAMMYVALADAQIGYQVSLLKSATGEPRANECVSCTVNLTNAEGDVVYKGTQSVITNEFGVASLVVGDNQTFANMDWKKLPLFVEVTVDGKSVGKTQVLSVPVAEFAKYVATPEGVITKEFLLGKWIPGEGNNRYYIFTPESMIHVSPYEEDAVVSEKYFVKPSGDFIVYYDNYKKRYDTIMITKIDDDTIFFGSTDQEGRTHFRVKE